MSDPNLSPFSLSYTPSLPELLTKLGCTNLLIVSSTDEALEDAPASLYPTITSSMVTVVFEEVNTQPISILSADGRMVKQYKGDNWQGEHAFDMSDMVIGQYYLRIVNKDQIHNLPFIRN